METTSSRGLSIPAEGHHHCLLDVELAALESSRPRVDYPMSYYDVANDEEVAGDGPVTMSRSQIVGLLEKVLCVPGSFVSVMDGGGTMIQFMLNEDGSVLLDIPHPPKRGSYAKRTTIAASLEVMRALGDSVRRDAIDGLAFERW